MSPSTLVSQPTGAGDLALPGFRLGLCLSLAQQQLPGRPDRRAIPVGDWRFRLEVVDGAHRVRVYDERGRLVVLEVVAPVDVIGPTIVSVVPGSHEWVTGFASCQFTGTVAEGPSRARSVMSAVHGDLQGHHRPLVVDLDGEGGCSALALRLDGTGWTSWHSRLGDDPHVASTSTIIHPLVYDGRP